MVIKTETDSTDITECSYSNKPTAGMYVVHTVYNYSTLCDIFTVCIFSILLLTAVQNVM